MGLYDILFGRKPLEKAAKQGDAPPAPAGTQDNRYIKGQVERQMKSPPAPPAKKGEPKKGLAKAYADSR